ncbi:hypothetical protein PVK06_001139 [Gossypium arboreum]|uniref:Uncharacterized protein n=1 Tax=Gossypium arboreum TaxID=29729 RepID=A0ABR0R0B3_GOSAR|nr:hypothetical protein PVK06_001139 [Gossypium arboreum]
MDSGDKQDRKGQFGETLEESSAFLGHVSIQEVNEVPLASGSDDLKVGPEALTRVVREVLEKVFHASLERTREMVQGRCADCEKKIDHSPLRWEPRSAKRFRSQWNVSKSSAGGSSSGGKCVSLWGL